MEITKKYRLECPSLPDEYHDPSDILIHAMFAVLGQYVSEEREFPHDHNHSEEAKFFGKEFEELWHWWTVTRPARELPKRDPNARSFIGKESHDATPEQKDLFHKWCMECGEIEDQWAEEDKEMMIRLVKIHGGLWT